jgi:hypothetical protein
MDSQKKVPIGKAILIILAAFLGGGIMVGIIAVFVSEGLDHLNNPTTAPAINSNSTESLPTESIPTIGERATEAELLFAESITTAGGLEIGNLYRILVEIEEYRGANPHTPEGIARRAEAFAFVTDELNAVHRVTSLHSQFLETTLEGQNNTISEEFSRWLDDIYNPYLEKRDNAVKHLQRLFEFDSIEDNYAAYSDDTRQVLYELLMWSNSYFQ